MITDEQGLEFVWSGYLRIDADGSVWRQKIGTRTGRRRPIAPTRADYLENNGYRRVRVGKRGSISAHRLVWLVARGPIPDGIEVNHKNLNKGDNRIDNLELMTHLENVQHAYANDAVPALRGEANGSSKLTEQQVVEIRHAVVRGEPKRAIARRFGISPTLVRHIVSGRAWKHAAFPDVSR